MVNLELLKRLIFIEDITKKLEPSMFDDIGIKINMFLEKSDDVSYAFQVLKIPYNIFVPKIEEVPKEINFVFDCQIELNVIYKITYILKEIYGDNMNIYVDYFSEYFTNFERKEKKIIIGGVYSENELVKHISYPIKANSIIQIDMNFKELKSYRQLFPGELWAYSIGGFLVEVEEDDFLFENGNEDNCCYDYSNRNAKYDGYNGWCDDAIDDAFEGDPMNTWNVD